MPQSHLPARCEFAIEALLAAYAMFCDAACWVLPPTKGSTCTATAAAVLTASMHTMRSTCAASSVCYRKWAADAAPSSMHGHGSVAPCVQVPCLPTSAADAFAASCRLTTLPYGPCPADFLRACAPPFVAARLDTVACTACAGGVGWGATCLRCSSGGWRTCAVQRWANAKSAKKLKKPVCRN